MTITVTTITVIVYLVAVAMQSRHGRDTLGQTMIAFGYLYEYILANEVMNVQLWT